METTVFYLLLCTENKFKMSLYDAYSFLEQNKELTDLDIYLFHQNSPTVITRFSSRKGFGANERFQFDIDSDDGIWGRFCQAAI